jgi:glycosyltransferase involved in cell wall biosynthesis
MVGHSCVLSWWRAVKGEAAPERYSTYRREVARGLRSARLLIAPTLAMLAALDREYGPLPRHAVIANARRAELFPPGPKEPFVFFAGRLWDEAKNASLLDAIAPELPWPVYVAGDARRPDGVLRAPAALRALGPVSSGEVAQWLGRAAIYALPARYEPFGLSALEAGLAGCALVLGDIPALREVWGDAALFAPVDDPGVWRSILCAVAQDGGLRDELARRARIRALEHSPDRMAQAYLSAYDVLSTRQGTI